MQITSVLALAGLAAAAPSNFTLSARNATGYPAGFPAGLKYRRSAPFANATALATRDETMSVDVSNLSVDEKLVGNTLNVESIASVYFNLDGNVTCTAQNPGTSGTLFDCGSTPYSFSLVNGTSTQFALQLYHTVDNTTHHSGKGDVETYCHDGGSSTLGSYEICAQVSPATIVLS
ncbi:hypothetical protein VM1G_07390 [Cytospora mali]|uniref:AA1-like domain-containing protein n=1 Tax=Cytospora mali TaxID=578113 RepID=A0A194W4L3_CYTMA|nr:hypothetical protein VM1G_07390 [Valsa mali]